MGRACAWLSGFMMGGVIKLAVENEYGWAAFLLVMGMAWLWLAAEAEPGQHRRG